MPIVNRVSASVFDKTPQSKGRQPSPEMIDKIRGHRTEEDVYEVLPIGDQKLATVR